MTRMPMCTIVHALVASALVGASVSYAEDLHALKAAASRYVMAIKAVLSLPRSTDCPETSSMAREYATAKVAYYSAARQAMPSLVQMAKDEKSDSKYGGDLIELFRGAGDEEDEQATVILMSKLRGCDNSKQTIQDRKAVENAQQVAEQFLRDFGRLEGD
jgi:hypothetical protein